MASANEFDIQPFAKDFDIKGQKAENATYNQDFTNFLSAQPTPQQTRDVGEDKYGYRDLTEQYHRTNEAANNVMNIARANPENVQARANNSGQIITQAQVSNISNNEVKGFMEEYTKLGEVSGMQAERLNAVERTLDLQGQLELQQQAKMMTPWLQKYESQQILQARDFSKYTFSNQLELNRLLANQSSGITLSEGEKNRAHALAMQESAFNNSLTMLEKQNEFALDLWN